jgi:hypothetical protein
MGSMVRAAGLRGLPALIDDLGGDGRALFAAYGVAAALVDTDDAVIPSLVAGRLLETAAADRDCPDLGLRLAARQDTAILGPLAIAIENSATLGEALDCATRFLFVHSPALTIAQVADPSGRPGVVGLRYGSTEMDPMPPQVCDNGLGLLHRIIVLLSGGRYGLRSVHLTHRPLAAVARYTEFFGADVRFGQPAAVLRVPATIIEARVDGANRVLREVALDYMRAHFPAPEQPLAERVRRLITTTDLPFSQVTAMVGLTEQSALTRAVRRWYGLSPRDLRRGQ